MMRVYQAIDPHHSRQIGSVPQCEAGDCPTLTYPWKDASVVAHRDTLSRSFIAPNKFTTAEQLERSNNGRADRKESIPSQSLRQTRSWSSRAKKSSWLVI